MKRGRIYGAQQLLADNRRGYRLHFWDKSQYRRQREEVLRFLTEYRAERHPYYCDCSMCDVSYDRFTGGTA